MTDSYLQISEFAKRAETNLRTLRYYEELGLLRPARRSAGKFRYYSPEQLERVAAIKRLQGLGLSLKEIQDVMVPSQSEMADALLQIQGTLDTQIELMGERIRQMQTELDELQAARRKVEECRTCEHAFDTEACGPCMRSSPAVFALLRSLA